MSKEYHYNTNCVNSNGRDIQRMTDNSVAVTYDTFLKHCEGVQEVAAQLGYAGHPRAGLTLKQDWHVGYYRSTFRGKPCYYMVWSAIEYIWTKAA
jgi:hypothetical protein